MNLSSPTNAGIADGQGVGIITDDEPRLSIGDASVVEGNTVRSRSIHRHLLGHLRRGCDRELGHRHGTAAAGSDYQAAADALTISRRPD